MTSGVSGSSGSGNNHVPLLIALCAVAASTMIVEIVIVKFIAFKVFHHFINMIVSTVVLSFAAAGTYLYLKGKNEADPASSWRNAAREALLYSITLMLSILLFCWIPIDPYNVNLSPIVRIGSLPIYFAILAVPFFFGGLCISRVLAESSLQPSRVLLFDLAAAAIAAAAAPAMLEVLNGYGEIALAAALGFVAYLAFLKSAGDLKAKPVGIGFAIFLPIVAATLAYPGWAFNTYGLDIRTYKGENLERIALKELNGISKTYWNALARIDVSNVGFSNDEMFFYGFVDSKNKKEGRLITVDKGANTRQFANKGKLEDQKFFGDSVVAIPYIAHKENPIKNVLIIGGGGGLDITVAKFFKSPKVDVLEMNPMTYKHVLLGEGDPNRDLFQPWVSSDATSQINIFNKEARHFCSSAPPGGYDVIQATGVDTFTAIASGALAFSDNYLYTYDAVKSYMRLLKPGGVLSLAYCREPEALPIRIFASYLACLEENGVKEPYKHVMVVGKDMSDILVKTTPFTPEELQSVRDWCKQTGAVLVFDPDRKTAETPGLRPLEVMYTKLGFADTATRQSLIDTYEKNIFPATDDKPYFYQTDRNESFIFSSNYSYSPNLAVLLIAMFCVVLIALPIRKAGISAMSGPLLARAVYFAFCGFAFLLYEVAIVQLFTVFVGGPAYALAVVLVAVLIGYSLGCFAVSKLPVRSSTFVAIGLLLFGTNMFACFALPGIISSLLSIGFTERIVFCALITTLLSCFTGLSVPLAMEAAKADSAREISWFWGISCSFNALGAACFPLISMQIGIKATLAVVAVLYLVANLLFAKLLQGNSHVANEQQNSPAEAA
ncbi:MAG: hypothetical protein DKT66_03275 [Candidatus Melainabacteria bacterium]|nr:MAG: hypothetical protein DKT66_03275 [Candidatus Melainabacteria bacterium]